MTRGRHQATQYREACLSGNSRTLFKSATMEEEIARSQFARGEYLNSVKKRQIFAP